MAIGLLLLLFSHKSCLIILQPAHQAPLPKELLRQEYWSGLPFPTPGTLPDPGIESTSPACQATFFLPESHM